MRLLLILLLSLSSLEGKILQTNCIEDALAYLDKSTWLLLDIDDTLLEAKNQLGRVKWYYHETQKLMQRGMESERAQISFYPQWVLCQTICPVRTVEKTTAAVVLAAKRLAKNVMGLTARDPPIAALTVEQLQKLHINLSNSAPPIPLQFDWGKTLYRNGVWFITDFLSKGESFARLLAAMPEARPKRVVFIDDGIRHLDGMEKALEKLKIEFIGIHYTKAHERPFDPEIADLQYSRLPEILSDEEAYLLLHQRESI